MRTAYGVFVTVVVLLALAGCQATTGKTGGRIVDDEAITTQVKQRLTTDRISNFSRVDVDTDRGVVHLRGVVHTAEQKARAAEVAREVAGVRRVDNNLQIQGSTP